MLTPAEVDKLAAKMPARLRASVLMAAWCAIALGRDRQSCAGATSAPIAASYGCAGPSPTRKGEFIVGPPKTAAGSRDVVVPPHIRPIIKAHLKNHVGKAADSLLFPGDDGKHMSSPAYRVYFIKARKAIGKPNLTPHQLRHTGAVLAAQSGATTAELMHRLGHTTVQMALRYQHVAEGRDAEIAERLVQAGEVAGNWCDFGH